MSDRCGNWYLSGRGSNKASLPVSPVSNFRNMYQCIQNQNFVRLQAVIVKGNRSLLPQLSE